MRNQLCAYAINSPSVFSKMANLSGLSGPDMLVRLSPEQIDQLSGTCGCFTGDALVPILRSYGLSGDVYMARTVDKSGNQVLALDIVRPDKNKKTGDCEMDQEPVYFRNAGTNKADSKARKIFHLSCEGRTFPLSSYTALSAYLEDRRNQPIRRSEIENIDPGIFKAIEIGVNKAFPQ